MVKTLCYPVLLLKVSYRKRLFKASPNCCLVWLYASPLLIKKRLENRQNHFMPVTLLKSQLSDLEIPTNAIEINADKLIKESLILSMKYFHK